jgi:feruloyl esterase
MRIVRSAIFVTAVFVTAPAFAATCESIAALKLPGTTITAAQVVAPGAFKPSPSPSAAVLKSFENLPAFCRVQGVIQPSSDSHIEFEVWLPMSGWNGKYFGVGNGGLAGSISYTFGVISDIPGLREALVAGYATASTDTGHQGAMTEGKWALGHPEKIIDYGYRAIHETTEKSKAIIRAFYGVAPKLSYYFGCSTGGRQGLAEAQRYPEDFNGIVAGASSWNQLRLHAARIALNLIVNKNPDSVIPPSKYSMIHNAVLNACDALDGVKDGVIEDPTLCHFNYTRLACKGADAADCLTKGQVESAQAMTSPIKDPNTGTLLYDGQLWSGSELGWAGIGGPQPTDEAVAAMRNIVLKKPNWDYRTMHMSTDVDSAAKADRGAMYSGNPNLRAFFDRGGKLLMYHGWGDSRVTPQNSVIYYSEVVKAVGRAKAANSIAFFMVPGMDHCLGGAGTATFDKMAAIEQWVETGHSPDSIVASRTTNGNVDRTRPLCPYPQVARYKGTGSTDEAANFTCKAP